MNRAIRIALLCVAMNSTSAASRGEINATVSVNRAPSADPAFRFDDAPAPSRSDAANRATFTILRGRRDLNGGNASRLNDGMTPRSADEPAANFFFSAGTDGGRLLVDLGEAIEIRQVNTYSWHVSSRGPQVYRLYAPDPDAEQFEPSRGREGDPFEQGWKLLATVDSRLRRGPPGGQYVVSVADSDGGVIARSRYLLFDISRTESVDPFGNTFFSEIDVLDGREYAPPQPAAVADVDVLRVGDQYAIEFDASQVPEIKPWIDATLKPACSEWYPKIVALLPSEGYAAPRRFRITFHSEMDGVAHASGRQIHCAAPWFLRNLDGEAAGAVVHEMVHIVQQYGRARGGERNPGWMVEGVADYIRWFLYEPPELRPRVDPRRAKYTDSYRTTAAFLNYAVQYHDAELVEKMNAAMRRGQYSDALWKEYTGKTVDELWAEFAKSLSN